MPKMKTRKCISKRVKRTGTGKYKYYKAGRRHLMTGKGGKRKRQRRNPPGQRNETYRQGSALRLMQPNNP